MAHRVYEAIVRAVGSGSLVEPFSRDEFRSVCPGFGKGTYNAFLDKHAVGNPGGNSELFVRVSPGQFKCVRPFKYNMGQPEDARGNKRPSVIVVDMMNLRTLGLKWFRKHRGSVDEPTIKVSRFYPAHESWNGRPVWWFEFPPSAVSNPRGWINFLCQRRAANDSFHHLRVPMGLFAACKRHLGFRSEKKAFSLFLSAEPKMQFREMRGPGGIEFGHFEQHRKAA